MNYLSWIYEIENYENHLRESIKDREDLSLLLNILESHTGLDAFIKFNETFLKTGVKPVEIPFTRLKKIYVYQNRHDKTPQQLARKLNVETRTIFQWLKEFGVEKRNGKSKDNKTRDLFE